MRDIGPKLKFFILFSSFKAHGHLESLHLSQNLTQTVRVIKLLNGAKILPKSSTLCIGCTNSLALFFQALCVFCLNGAI